MKNITFFKTFVLLVLIMLFVYLIGSITPMLVNYNSTFTFALVPLMWFLYIWMAFAVVKKLFFIKPKKEIEENA